LFARQAGVSVRTRGTSSTIPTSRTTITLRPADTGHRHIPNLRSLWLHHRLTTERFDLTGKGGVVGFDAGDFGTVLSAGFGVLVGVLVDDEECPGGEGDGEYTENQRSDALSTESHTRSPLHVR
jgi:hypothetical protein